jgi:hypothetical protein
LVGIQPPNEKVLYLCLALSALLLVFWWGLGVRHRFQGPPVANRGAASRTPAGSLGELAPLPSEEP